MAERGSGRWSLLHTGRFTVLLGCLLLFIFLLPFMGERFLRLRVGDLLLWMILLSGTRSLANRKPILIVGSSATIR